MLATDRHNLASCSATVINDSSCSVARALESMPSANREHRGSLSSPSPLSRMCICSCTADSSCEIGMCTSGRCSREARNDKIKLSRLPCVAETMVHAQPAGNSKEDGVVTKRIRIHTTTTSALACTHIHTHTHTRKHTHTHTHHTRIHGCLRFETCQKQQTLKF